jgi:hypothetical protein
MVKYKVCLVSVISAQEAACNNFLASIAKDITETCGAQDRIKGTICTAYKLQMMKPLAMITGPVN